MTETNSQGLKAEKDKKWEQVQIKAFTMWVNTTIEPLGYKVVDINEDLKDGVKLCIFLEEVGNTTLKGWSKKPAMRIHMLENVSIGLKFIQGDLGVRLVSIGPEDIVDGRTKLTLGLLWSLFRRLRIETISSGGQSSEEGLLAWLRKMTEGYDGVNIRNFRDSFNDGLAFSALINAMDNEALDYNTLDHKAKEHNLLQAFEVAEKRLGIPKLLDAEDLLSDNADERAVILYSSLFFHAWMADEEKRKMRQGMNSINDRIAQLEKENEEYLRANQALQDANKEKDDRIAELLKEIAFLREANKKGEELRAILEEKIRLLQSLLDEANRGNESASEREARLQRELEEARRRAEELAAGLNKSSSDYDKLATDTDAQNRLLSDLEKRKNDLLNELNALREQVKKMLEDRARQERELQELLKEIERLRKQQINQSQARVGLDSLKSNLEDHLEDLYKWRDLHDIQLGEDLPDFDLAKVIQQLNGKGFVEQLNVLDEQLQQENRSLARIVRLQDSKDYLNDVVILSGWLTLKGLKDWKRRWFVLTGETLNYFEDSESVDPAGTIPIEDCEILRQKASDDEESGKKVWPLKITIGDRKLFLRAASKKERHSWFSAICSRTAYLKYIKFCSSSDTRPDTRLVGLLKAPSSPSLHLGNRPVHPQSIQALSKGILGRSELEDISLENSGLTDALFIEVCDAVEKLSGVKRFNFAKNKLTSGVTERFVSSVIAEIVEDLDFSYNKLGDDFVTGLGGLLTKTANLNSLGLHGLGLTSSGASALSASLTSNTQVKLLNELQLNDNALSDAGVKSLEPLFKSIEFNSVFLAGNKIGDAGALSLASSLNNTGVHALDLSNNQIGVKGALALKELMENNSALREVKLSGNPGLFSNNDSATLFSAKGFVFSDLTFTRS